MARYRIPALLAIGLSLAAAGPALASGDSCEPGWSLDFAAKPGCANIPVLVPGNDTRANLVLLLADRHRTPGSVEPALRPALDWRDLRLRFGGREDEADPDFAAGEGSRCRSNAGGSRSFAQAVEASRGVPADERKALVEARERLTPNCGEASSAPPSTPFEVGDPSTAEGRAFAAYLRSAADFYAGRFEDAAAGFSALASSTDSWIAETAAYMVARTAVNRMQAGAFEQYGTFKGPDAVDKGLASAAQSALEGYLRARPDGRYAASAKGLLRRVDWLSGRTESLAARYAALLAEPPATRGLSDADLADEIDSKLLPVLKPDMTRDTILLAVLDLWSIRKDPEPPQPGRIDLAAQREAFAGEPGLLAYLEAAYALYADGNHGAVVSGIPDDARRKGGDHLWFSRQFLRGLALEAKGDRNARGFWKELAVAASRPLDRATAELALARNDELRGDVADAFAPGSPVANPAIRAILLVNDAGPDLLRSRALDESAPARERQVALFTLLRKQLTHGDYAGFLRDVPNAPPGSKDGPIAIDPLGEGPIPFDLVTKGETKGEIGCPTLERTAAGLARDPESARGRLCLAEWLRLNGFDPDRYPGPPRKGSLGSGPTSYPGTETTRGAIYASLISDRATPPDDRAYALFRAVKCYEPSGINACGGADAPKAERRRWYDALRREFPNSRWARSLRYWW